MRSFDGKTYYRYVHKPEDRNAKDDFNANDF